MRPKLAAMLSILTQKHREDLFAEGGQALYSLMRYLHLSKSKAEKMELTVNESPPSMFKTADLARLLHPVAIAGPETKIRYRGLPVHTVSMISSFDRLKVSKFGYTIAHVSDHEEGIVLIQTIGKCPDAEQMTRFMMNSLRRRLVTRNVLEVLDAITQKQEEDERSLRCSNAKLAMSIDKPQFSVDGGSTEQVHKEVDVRKRKRGDSGS